MEQREAVEWNQSENHRKELLAAKGAASQPDLSLGKGITAPQIGPTSEGVVSDFWGGGSGPSHGEMDEEVLVANCSAREERRVVDNAGCQQRKSHVDGASPRLDTACGGLKSGGSRPRPTPACRNAPVESV